MLHAIVASHPFDRDRLAFPNHILRTQSGQIVFIHTDSLLHSQLHHSPFVQPRTPQYTRAFCLTGVKGAPCLNHVASRGALSGNIFMNGKIRFTWITALIAAVALSFSTPAAQRVTNNENVTNKTTS